MENFIKQVINNNNNIEPLFNYFHYTICYRHGNQIIYILNDYSRINNNNKLVKIKEIFVGNTTEDNIEKVLNSSISVYDFLASCSNKYRIGKISNKIFDKKEILNMEDISNRIPLETFKLKDLMVI